MNKTTKVRCFYGKRDENFDRSDIGYAYLNAKYEPVWSPEWDSTIEVPVKIDQLEIETMPQIILYAAWITLGGRAVQTDDFGTPQTRQMMKDIFDSNWVELDFLRNLVAVQLLGILKDEEEELNAD